MIGQRIAVIVMGLALSLASSGCSKEEAKDKPAASQPKPSPAVDQAKPSPAAPPAPVGAPPPSAPVAVKAAVPAATASATAATGCAKLFAVSGKQLDTGKISCIEGAMEGKGHEFDSKACNGLENAWPVGMGNFGVLWASCQAEQKFDDSACNAVLAKCF